MQLNSLPRMNTKLKKRVGRGIGSGRGKTGGRGTKGQKARGKIMMGFTSGAVPLYKKLPFLRGQGNKGVSEKPVLISLETLNKFEQNKMVDLESLVGAKIVLEREVKGKGVKILAKGELKRSLTVKVPVSKRAGEEIKRLGGKVG